MIKQFCIEKMSRKLNTAQSSLKVSSDGASLIVIIIIIIMVIFKCYFSGELIALSYKKKQQQRCEHRIRNENEKGRFLSAIPRKSS